MAQLHSCGLGFGLLTGCETTDRYARWVPRSLAGALVRTTDRWSRKARNAVSRPACPIISIWPQRRSTVLADIVFRGRRKTAELRPLPLVARGKGLDHCCAGSGRLQSIVSPLPQLPYSWWDSTRGLRWSAGKSNGLDRRMQHLLTVRLDLRFAKADQACPPLGFGLQTRGREAFRRVRSSPRPCTTSCPSGRLQATGPWTCSGTPGHA